MAHKSSVREVADWLGSQWEQAAVNKASLYEDYLDEQNGHRRGSLKTYEEYSRWVTIASTFERLAKKFEAKFGIKVKHPSSSTTNTKADLLELVERAKEERIL